MKHGEMPQAAIYPDPPPVPVLLLLVIVVPLVLLVNMFLLKPYRCLLTSVILNAWPFYFCLWLRQLNPDSRSPFWCELYVIVELFAAALSIQPPLSPRPDTIGAVLGFLSVVLGITTIYLVRADLLKHYNEREPIGLYLSPVATLLFSFLYFQVKLYEVSEIKRQQAKKAALDAFLLRN